MSLLANIQYVRNLPPQIDFDDQAVQAACAATLYELLRSGSREDWRRRIAQIPAMVAELKLAPMWRQVLVVTARWMYDEEPSTPTFLRPRGYETSSFLDVPGGLYPALQCATAQRQGFWCTGPIEANSPGIDGQIGPGRREIGGPKRCRVVHVLVPRSGYETSKFSGFLKVSYPRT